MHSWNQCIQLNFIYEFYILQTLFIFAFSHTCREPEAPPTFIKTADDITEESRWIVPGNFPNDYFIQFANNVTYETIYRLGSCNDYIQRTHQSATDPISTGSTCPWYYVKNIDPNRIPRVIVEAECACKCCGKSSCPHTRCSISHKPNLCQKVYRYTAVLMKKCVNGIYEYRDVVLPVSVGCTCVRCPLPITRGMDY